MSKEMLENGITKIIENIIGIEIGESQLYMELELTGINSIKFIQIIVDIEEKYKVEFDDDLLLDYTSFKTLNAFFISIVQKLSNKIS